MAATKEQEEKYLEGGGCHCLYCGDDDIEGGPVQVDAGMAWQSIKCNACEAQWDDVYLLVTVDEAPYQEAADG